MKSTGISSGFRRDVRRYLKQVAAQVRTRREAETLLRRHVQPKLNLRNLHPLATRRGRKVYSGERDGQKIFVKTYHGDEVRYARPQVGLAALLSENNIPTPAVLASLLEPLMVNDYGCGCLLMEWIDAAESRKAPEAFRVAAFQLLGRIHALQLSRPGASGTSSTAFGEVPRLRSTRIVAGLQRSIRNTRRLEAEFKLKPDWGRVEELINRVPDAIGQCPAVSLIHMDFGPANLIRRRDGDLYVVDLDDMRKGCFAIDLASALMHFLIEEWRTGTTAEFLPPEPWISQALELYWPEVPASFLTFWNEWAETLLPLAFFREIGNLVSSSHDFIGRTRKQRTNDIQLAASCFRKFLDTEAYRA